MLDDTIQNASRCLCDRLIVSVKICKYRQGLSYLIRCDPHVDNTPDGG